MTTVIERERTEVVPRKPVERRPPQRRPRRGWFAWIASLVVVVVAAIGLLIAISGDADGPAEIAIDGSGESVYQPYEWYAELEGFYLAPPALAPSGESAYLEFDWYAQLGGFYLAPPYEAPVNFGSGESVYMAYDWYTDLSGFYLPPPAG